MISDDLNLSGGKRRWFFRVQRTNGALFSKPATSAKMLALRQRVNTNSANPPTP